MKTVAFVALLFAAGIASAQTPPPIDPAVEAPMANPPAPPTADPGAPDRVSPVPSAQQAKPIAPPPMVMAAPIAAPPPPAPASYPRCSRTVTDGCVQDMSRDSDTKGGPPAHRKRARH